MRPAWSVCADRDSLSAFILCFAGMKAFLFSAAVTDRHYINSSSRSGLSITNLPWIIERSEMKRNCFECSRLRCASARQAVLCVVAALFVCCGLQAVTFTEDFSADPATNGWKIFGDTNLFQWDSTNHNLAVTWDSSQSNSYFYHPLGTVLGKADAFAVDFDIRLNSLHWTNTFQLAVGLLNLSNAVNPGFSRALGYSPDIFEFNYFPDSGDGFGDPNLAASMTDDTDSITSFPNFYFIFDTQPMILGTNYHVTLTHAAGAGLISATVFTNGQVYSTMPLFYSGAIGDLRLDTLSVSSYSGAGQDPAFAGSLLAQGTVDNFVVTLPLLAHNLTGSFTNGIWQSRVTTYSDTHYTLQRSTNFTSWSDVTAPVAGNGDVLLFSDTNALTDKAFYRVRADKP
jgi:hypothetical protein